MSNEQTLEMAGQLRDYAEHFQQRDWDYTRNLGSLQAIRYDRPEDSLRGRIVSAARWLFRRRPAYLADLGPGRIYMARHVMRRDRHLPDGILDGGSIITFWEETGEYLQYVQPSVGSLIADWMEAEPSSPYARRVADEMERIVDAYAERVAS